MGPLRELLIAAVLYAFVLGAHVGHRKFDAWRERKRAADEAQHALDALSPLSGRIVPSAGAHGVAFMTACVGPSCVEAVKHYVVHFLIYSGYVIPH